MKGGRILVAEDKPAMLQLWKRLLEPDHVVTSAEDGTRALALIPGGDFDVVVTDVMMPGADGFAVLAETRRASPDTEVVLVTAYGTVEHAVQAMKEGAFDFITKPFDPDQARIRVERALERRRLRVRAAELELRLQGGGLGEMVGESPAAKRLFELLRKAAATELTVLLTGESGTGKELAARVLHHESHRREGRFVPVNCGAIPNELIESELFGHTRGAFSGATHERAGLFEAAQGGTLFLDEVSELPLAMQVKLNRALQEKEIRRVGESVDRKVDVRVVAATNLDLREQVAAGRFREDLFYRLNVFPIRLPALRDRREDIRPLCAALLARIRERTGTGAAGIAPDAMRALLSYGWPGNIRELENALQRASALSSGTELRLEDLPPEILEVARHEGPEPELLALSFREAVKLAQDQAARRYLAALLAKHGGSVTQAAEAAGMARETLHRQLKRYGLDSHDFRG